MIKLDQEIEIARKEVSLNGNKACTHHCLGKLLLKKGDFYGAVNAQLTAININEKNPAFHMQLSFAYDRLGEVDNAIVKIRDAILLNDKNAQFYHHLGGLFLKKGDLNSSKDCQLKAIEINPDNAAFHIQLSYVYSRLGDKEKAIVKARDAICLKDDNASFHHHLAVLLLECGKYKPAKDSFYKAAEIDPDFFCITDEKIELLQLIRSGKLAIIPAGFRCHAKIKIDKFLNIKQPTMPFDNGFFPPQSVASIIRNPSINLKYFDDKLSHAVCIKHENYVDSFLGRGIKFETSSYEEVKRCIRSKDQSGINKYLDSTFGFYTLDKKHNYVLAHYNWHEFASSVKSKGVYSHELNIQNINKILNRRIVRMFDCCQSADHILFVTNELQGYRYMMVDSAIYDLYDFSEMTDAVKYKFKSNVDVVEFSKVDTASKILSFIS